MSSIYAVFDVAQRLIYLSYGFDSLEYLPLEEVKDLSEMDFTVKHVGPVMEAFSIPSVSPADCKRLCIFWING